MDINIILCPECESVYMVSGVFTDSDAFITQSDNVTYLTVLPLDVRYMPYTIKLMGAQVMSGSDMAISCKISKSEYALKLGKRYSFIFTNEHKAEPKDLASKFFYCVKGGHFGSARAMMSVSLSQTLSDEGLRAFFDEFIEFICVKGIYYAVDKAGEGHKAILSFEDGLIDNISVD